ncbi:C4-dicarboxylate transporter DctA [Catenulispora sp. NF23]|uniref:C4-dicarboxylate transporter DctA n=1 Tax=Catenulispora pinistramenti TaxID=2705254 RepID=UPI001BA97F98|nr:C4-dicarboxylate transporter DctA [Catenulispora pinistramenti]MBS2535805.1 C4-dicarboxylate transporter DctA [Catenulispora pinistramenti]
MSETSPPPTRSRWYRQLYFWVLVGIAAGIALGAGAPGVATQLQPLGDSFVNLIRMVITPVVFVTVVTGIAGVGKLREVGRVGIRSLIYFEVLSTVALAIGLLVMDVLRPGAGVHAKVPKATGAAADYIKTGQTQSAWHYLTDMVPNSIVGAFSTGSVLQVLVIAVLVAVAIKLVGAPAEPAARGIEVVGKVLFKVLGIVMYAAPVGAFGAMSFTVGKYGLHTLTSLGKLMAVFYGTSAVFVFVVLGAVGLTQQVNIFKLVRYIAPELLVVLGTSSSETVLPRIMDKMEQAGVRRDVVGLTVPAGYSFNLDGTCIYLTLGALYIAQALDVHLSLAQQVTILGVLLLTSKGAAGVTGSGFIVLAATLSTVGTIPVAGIMLIFGIDKFMSECRALTNLCGTAVGTIVIAGWEDALDRERLFSQLNGHGEGSPEPVTDGVAIPA